MKFWPYWRFDGFYWKEINQIRYYITKNESCFPNFCILFEPTFSFVYFALAPGIRFHIEIVRKMPKSRQNNLNKFLNYNLKWELNP